MVDFRDWEGGMRDVGVGVFLLAAIAVFAVCCFVGAWTIAAWAWGVV